LFRYSEGERESFLCFIRRVPSNPTTTTTTKGVVKEKETARREYNQAVQRGDRAYLLEKNLPDVFQVLVGNVPSYTRCTIKLTYIVELSNAGGEGIKRYETI